MAGNGVAKPKGTGLFGGRSSIGPLLLLVCPPLFSVTMWYTNTHLQGDISKLATVFTEDGIYSAYNFFTKHWPNPFDPVAWKILLSYMAFELLLMRLVPGKRFVATATATGHEPVYTANGVQCYLLSIAVLVTLTYNGIINPALVYDKFGELVAAVNLFAMVFVLFLYVKGLTFPSTKDCGTSGNFIIDYYWGTELYPRILGWDVKMFTNCRFGMMFWQLGLLCYAYKQYTDIGYVSDSMFVCVALQSIYIFKFYWWETGYLCSMDIQHDRAGFYICWGCLVYLPVVYTSQGFWLVKHPVHLGVPLAAAIFTLGLVSIYINYDCDRQRQFFRATAGKCKVWGKEPDYVVAKYTTNTNINGTTKTSERTSLLLTSGWWGVSRHFHYVPEILASFFWSAPALFTHAIPYFYVTYLTILLLDRAWRDDARCSRKYGKYWNVYTQKVPYFIIPGLI